MATPRLGQRVVEEVQERKAAGPEPDLTPDVIVPEPEPRVMDPNEAADLLLKYLPSYVQEIVLEVRDTLRQPLWCCLMGYTMKVADWGELFSPRILGEWSAQLPSQSERVCQKCERVFHSPVPEGMYCCARCYFGKEGHSPECLIPNIHPKAVATPEPDFDQEEAV